MANFILITGDTVVFKPTFGAATVTVAPGTLSGTGQAKIAGQAVCIEGDESAVTVPGCAYISGAYVTPGTGTLSIAALAGDQIAQKTNCSSKRVLLKGGEFSAKFAVTSPAMQPPPGPGSPVPDPNSQYSGSGSFVATNATVKGG